MGLEVVFRARVELGVGLGVGRVWGSDGLKWRGKVRDMGGDKGSGGTRGREESKK